MQLLSLTTSWHNLLLFTRDTVFDLRVATDGWEGGRFAQMPKLFVRLDVFSRSKQTHRLRDLETHRGLVDGRLQLWTVMWYYYFSSGFWIVAATHRARETTDYGAGSSEDARKYGINNIQGADVGLPPSGGRQWRRTLVYHSTDRCRNE